MAYGYSYGQPVNNTNYRTWYSNNFLYTDGYGFPTGNLDSTGNRPVQVYGVWTDWSVGATYHALNYAGSGNVGSGRWGSSGGTFRHVVGHGSGELGAGRNTGNGLTLRDSADGDTATGGICGSMSWATCPNAPTMLEATPLPGGKVRVRFSGNSDGGAGITGWVLQYATNSGFSGATTIASSGTTEIQLVPGQTYWFRAAGRNGVSDGLGRYGQWSGALSAKMLAGGKMRVAGAWKDTTWKYKLGGRWIDSYGKIRVSGAWRDVK